MRCTAPPVAAGSEQGLSGPDAADWTSRIEAAVADLHVALYWADEHCRRRSRPGHQRVTVALVAGKRTAGVRPELAGQVPDPGRAAQ